jgi:hypothetical protein
MPVFAPLEVKLVSSIIKTVYSITERPEEVTLRAQTTYSSTLSLW